MSPPEKPALKDPKDFKLIGSTVPRVDVSVKTNGTAEFTIDVDVPGMLTALVARAPRFGGVVKSFDASAAKQVRGVVDVVQIPSGVAVLAEGFWAAKLGRDALTIEWDESKAETRSSDELWALLRATSRQAGVPARDDGNYKKALRRPNKVIEAVFEYPMLAHAPMEPLDAVALLKEDGSFELWTGCQGHSFDHAFTAAALDIPPEKITIKTLFAGGSFGRRVTPTSELAVEAAHVAKASGRHVPIKLIWTREDDIRGGQYRPMFLHKVRGAIDKQGNIVGWHQLNVGKSIAKGTPFEGFIKNGIDPTMVEGSADTSYAIPNLKVEATMVDIGVSALWWRSVGHTHNAYTVEVFLDQLFRAANKDPLEGRRALLKGKDRHLGVLNLAAEKAGWGQPMPKGKARGIAVHQSYGTYVAQVAEISLNDDGTPKVERVVVAVDCGVAVNPDIVRSQMEGGVGFGLGAAMLNEITLDKGHVVQSNFHNYRQLRIRDMPEVEVHIVPSTVAPTGVGEPGVPPIAPAVANAYLALTGKPLVRLPFRSLVKGDEGG